MKLRNIEILEKDSNKKGDLFGRLMSDLFHALGYDEPRLNIHKSGREIDLNSYHRTESKIAIAECKAHFETIGGSDINKFVGVIDAEKRKLKKDKAKKGYDLVGYFISLSGFKETAIEQENEVGNNRVILIKPEKIVEELIKGRILVSKEKAISTLSYKCSGLALMDYTDLLAYDKGWIWVFYYSNSEGQKPSHFALVHAEGKPLLKDLSKEIMVIDNVLKKTFNGLILLNNEDSKDETKKNLTLSKEKYFKYLENELGDIQFEGLPTDKEAGSMKVKLENIFVPIHLTQSHQNRLKDEFEIEEKTRVGIGKILHQNSRLAILAKPGGGKSTLIKRIAIAYAFPDRRKQINDKLPDEDWFPIFLRCRELGDKVKLSITDILNGIPHRAEIHSCADDFSILVSRALQNGNALLLIDGLDEISEDINRIAFVNQLRTFIATYPTINIIVTSRESGFRAVAGSLATYCENYTVSKLIPEEIEELCLKWHKAIIDESENTKKEANKLSELILKDSRIKVLAENPLLLTTLLFVKRWAGYLPTKRSVLYQEMIKLLLVTWNVEGHEILDIEEAEPQLAFVAYWMTKNGQQTISAEELNSCLIDARKQMPEILGYTNVNPSEFIRRVESRSSLLILAGHKQLESGIITAVYEFLHLSFQEYLTAKAIVKKFIPQIDIEHKIVDIIIPNVNNENWKEVIPLVAVLLERDAKDLIEYLVSESKSIANLKKPDLAKKEKLAPTLLGSCLASEVQINRDLLDSAIEWYAKNGYNLIDRGTSEIILNNKFGPAFRAKIKDLYCSEFSDLFSPPIGSLLSEIFGFDFHNSNNNSEIFSEIWSDSRSQKCFVLIGLMGIAWRIVVKKTKYDSNLMSEIRDLNEDLLILLNKKDKVAQFSICWYIAFAVDAKLFKESLVNEFVYKLVKLWVNETEPNLVRVVSWSLSKLLKPNSDKTQIFKIRKLKQTIKAKFHKPNNEFDKLTSVYLGTIVGEKFEQNEIEETFKHHMKSGSYQNDLSSSFSLFLNSLKINLSEQAKTDS